MEGFNDDNYSEPFIYANGENANGEFRIAFYRDYKTFEININSKWSTPQTVYINNNYITSEGISVDSKKADVLNAYEKYGIKEYDLSKITQMGLDSLDIVLKGINLSDTFLYVDNSKIFDDSYTGIDYWGGLGAYVFILDSNYTVVKIVSFYPTSG